MTALAMMAEVVAAPHAVDPWLLAGVIGAGSVSAIGLVNGCLSIVGWFTGRSEKAREQALLQESGWQKALSDGQATILARMAETSEALERSMVAKHADSSTRIDRLEEENKNFRPGQQIDRDMTRMSGDLDHEKRGRLAAQDQTVRVFGEHMNHIMELQRGQARLEAENRATSGAIGKLEAVIDKLIARFDEKLDRMSDCLTAIARKVMP